MGLVISPPFPIICNPLRFLKSLNLNSVGLGLDAIPFEFEWNLVVWKPFGVQFEPKAILGSNEAGIEIVDVLDDSCPSEGDGDSDSVRAEIWSKPVSKQGNFGTGPKLVLEFGEVGVEPPLIFEDDVNDSFDRVADFGKEEELEILILAVQPSTLKESQPSEGQKRKRIPTDISHVCLFKSRAFSSPSQPKSTKLKPIVKPTRKSSRIATQSIQKPRKKGGCSRQSLPVIEEIVSSLEGSPLRDPEITPREQGSPQTPAVSKGTAPAEPSSEPTLSALKKSIAKRKLSPKQPPTQGPTERSPIEPSAKKAKKAAPSVSSSKLAQLLQRSVVRCKNGESAVF